MADINIDEIVTLENKIQKSFDTPIFKNRTFYSSIIKKVLFIR